MKTDSVAIIGAGPAGMSCAYTLAQSGQTPIIFEKDNASGGLCRTLDFDGYLFDIGGHRFLSKSDEITRLWHEIMGKDMLHVKRLSRIHFNKKFFKYPLNFLNTFLNLGPLESARCVLSLFWYKLRKPLPDDTFEGWIINRFGKRLFEIFFKTYTEKVWAVACKDISADWATQRIRGLSFKVAVKKAFFKKNKKSPKTLSDSFLYPRTGPGEFYNRLKNKIIDSGGNFIFSKKIVSLKCAGTKIISIIGRDQHSGKEEEIGIDYLFSSMPLPTLIKSIIPHPPQKILDSANKLRFRSFLVVNIILDKKNLFPDQWIYIQDPGVSMGRIQNYKNWSPAMTIDPEKTSLGLEYFCNENDELWKMNDIDLINYAVNELERIGIVARKYLISGFVVRQPDVYPVYEVNYKQHLTCIKKYLSNFTNLQTCGRQGLFHYDNSDHALLTGIYAAKNYMNEGPFDVWNINLDEEYLEN